MTRRRAVSDVSTKLQRIAELAERDKKVKFTSLAHLLTPDFLKECFHKLNQKGAPGTDGVTMEAFKLNLDVEIDHLWTELRAGRYRASPVKRVYIPKANGKQRPLGIPSVRDRVVQRAVGEILSAIYEPYFCDFSYGFRPGRSTHDALESLRLTIDRLPVRHVVDADISKYFDSVGHHRLREFLQHRIADRTILRLIGKWLKSGILEDGIVSRSDEGTPQGGPLSPLLANIYLHYTLDLWFERRFQSSAVGKCALVRYADDFVVCFEHRVDADRFLLELKERLAQNQLQLSEEKTKQVEFGKWSEHNGKKGPSEVPRSFDFLGFTHYMRKRGKRGYRTARKPSRKSRNKFLRGIKEWIGKHRDLSVWFHSKVLSRKLKGFYNYFGLRHCRSSLRSLKWQVERIWIMELRKRSQRHKLQWWRVTRYPWFRTLPNPKLR